jgi:hypothetical protein
VSIIEINVTCLGEKVALQFVNGVHLSVNSVCSE